MSSAATSVRPTPAPRDPRRRGGRAVLVVVLTAVAAVAATVLAALVLLRPADTVGTVDLDQPLRIPNLAPSTVDADGTRVFDLTMQIGRSDPTGLGETETWGVNGAHLAPTLRVQRGERIRMDVHNDLPEVTSLHWHGMHVPAASDGGPHQPVAPGASWSPSWEVDQPATTAWYHPHAHGTTAEHVRRGVYGMFLVDDPNVAPVGLPDEYGGDDVPVMVQDTDVAGDGSFRSGSGFLRVAGPVGDTLLVNGTVGPYLDVTTEAVRLRLLNASGGRTYDFALADGRRMDLIGTDGGLLPVPVATDSVMLSPGERAEVVVRLVPGERVVLQSRPPELDLSRVGAMSAGALDRFDVLELRAADRLATSPALPATLAERPDLSLDDVEVTRTFDLGDGDLINGSSMDMARVDEVVTAGATEEWVVRNLDGMVHNFHLHGTSFVVAELDGAPPPAHLSGWKDTVLLRPGVTARLVVQFTGAADPQAPFMYHCHLLTHGDAGMMGQLVVVEPGGEPALVHDAAHESPDVGAPRDETAALFPGATGHDHGTGRPLIDQ